MNDYVIRFTPREDDVSYEQLLELIKSVIDDGTEPSGWKVLQHGEFDVMAPALVIERAWVGELLAKEASRPLISFNGDSEEITRMMKSVMEDHQFGPLNYIFPDGDFTESITMESEGKKWIGSIYCPDLPVGSLTNRSEDSLGGIAKIVTHDKNCECKCYGWEEFEDKLKEKVVNYEPTHMVD